MEREAPQFLQNCAPALTGALQLGHALAGGVVNVAVEGAGGVLSWLTALRPPSCRIHCRTWPSA